MPLIAVPTCKFSTLLSRVPTPFSIFLESNRVTIEVAHLTMAPLLFVLLVVPELPVERLFVIPFVPFPGSEGVQAPPGRPTQLFG
jgi:hypothetical protein